jgi:flavin-dependent dehydrogenase
LVIGAGPAGVTAAKVLADAGRDVTIIEASRFPRDKVCGECLSSLGQATLRQIGFGDTLRRLDPVRLTHSTMVDRAGRSATLRLPQEVAGVSRWTMDPALVEDLPASVERRLGQRVLRLEQCKAFLANGDVLEADQIVLADGKGTLSGATDQPPRPTGDLGLKAHFTNVRLDFATIGLFALRGHYVGVAPVRDGERLIWNVAMNVPAAKLRQGEPHDELLQRLLRENPAFGDALRRAERVRPWKASPLPRFAPRPSPTWSPGVLPIGNSVAALEPIGGEGMGLAIASAHAAAMCLVEGRDPATLDAVYRKLWRTRRWSCRLFAKAMSHDASAAATVQLARTLPMLSHLGLRLTGKTAGGSADSPVASPALS